MQPFFCKTSIFSKSIFKELVDLKKIDSGYFDEKRKEGMITLSDLRIQASEMESPEVFREKLVGFLHMMQFTSSDELVVYSNICIDLVR